jgi:teichuronic acid exporter
MERILSLEERGALAAESPLEESEGLGLASEVPSDRSLVHSVAWVAAGDWLGQLLSWASFVVVVRLIPPADFGIATIAGLLFPYMALITAFGIPRAVVVIRDLTEDQLAQLNAISFVISVFWLAVALAIARPFASFFSTPRVAPVMMVAATTIVLVGIQGVPAAVLAKEFRFRLLTVLGVISGSIGSVTVLILAVCGFGYWSLVLGNVVAAVCRTAMILRARPCRLAWPRLEEIRKPLRFGSRIMVSMIASNSYSNLDNFVAGKTLGHIALGLYGTAWEFANMPVEKIATLITTVLPSYLSLVQTEPALLRRYLRTLTETVSLATFPATVGLGLVAHELVPLAFGPRWSGMIGALQVLAFYAGFRSIAALLPRFLVAVGEVTFAMWNDVAGFILLPVAFYLGSRYGITGIAWGWIFGFPLIALPLFAKTLSVLDFKVGDYLRVLRPALEGTSGMMLAVEVSRLVFPAQWPLILRLILEVATGVLSYVGLLRWRHRDRLEAMRKIATDLWMRVFRGSTASVLAS